VVCIDDRADWHPQAGTEHLPGSKDIDNVSWHQGVPVEHALTMCQEAVGCIDQSDVLPEWAVGELPDGLAV